MARRRDLEKDWTRGANGAAHVTERSADLAKFESEVLLRSQPDRDEIKYVLGIRSPVSRYCAACESYST